MASIDELAERFHSFKTFLVLRQQAFMELPVFAVVLLDPPPSSPRHFSKTATSAPKTAEL